VASELFPTKRFHIGAEGVIVLDLEVEIGPVEPNHLLAITIRAKHVRIPERGSASDVDVAGAVPNIDDLSHRTQYTILEPPPGVAPGLSRSKRDGHLLPHGGVWSPRRESNPHLHLRRVAGNPLPHREMNLGAPARSRTGPCDVGDRRASTTPRGLGNLVRVAGLAPATSCFQGTRSSLSELHPADGPCGCRSRSRPLMRRPLLPLSYRSSRDWSGCPDLNRDTPVSETGGLPITQQPEEFWCGEEDSNLQDPDSQPEMSTSCIIAANIFIVTF
jgi:hypothetical protein